MASALRKLTGVGGDVRKIAALLQKKAPPGHKLAYINDEEAALLKARGGSGKPHADTGIPSYEDGMDVANEYGVPSGQEFVDANTVGGDAVFAPPAITDVAPLSPVAPVTAGAPAAAAAPIDIGFGADRFTPSAAPTTPVGKEIDIGFGPGKFAPEAAADKEKPMSKDTLTRLGLAGGLGLLGASTARKAAASGQAGAQQIQGLAAPYQKQGAELQAQAQRGELTPAAQQSLQAVQAQAAQAAQSRGGVGSQQTQAQVEAYRQQLLAQQYDYGLKLSGIGDNIALGAIKTGLEADRYVQQLNNSFYTNMAYIASGMSPGIRVGGNQ
jgi:hypothetical protein